MIRAANLGFPRIGRTRELKKATEAYWAGESDAGQLAQIARALRHQNWREQADAGLSVIPSNDFSFYDQVLDTTAMLGAVPPRFSGGAGAQAPGTVDLDTYFAMARGTDDAPAMEMTKWFDTNYHYIVPEFHRDQQFHLASTKPIDEFEEAKAAGVHTRPVLLGPVTYLALGKAKESDLEPQDLLERVLPVYEEVLKRLAAAGADWVQIDEPRLALDLTDAERASFPAAYKRLAAAGPKLMLATYFDGLRDNTELAAQLPVDGLHVDLVRAPDQLESVLQALPGETVLSLGLIDGRNVWRADLSGLLPVVEQAKRALGADRLELAPSCSLLHTPIDLEMEDQLDAELKSWLAFAKQKLHELSALATAGNHGRDAARQAFDAADQAIRARRDSARVRDPKVRARTAAITEADKQRHSAFHERRKKQQKHLQLPKFPTTTIGSFPQTREVRRARGQFRRGEIDARQYEDFLKTTTEQAVRLQEELGLDVLVHGEFERTDMVEYFGEQLEGFAFTRHAWVQSFGSRYVRPPIIYGDVSRPEAMTVKWSAYAQSLTDKPVKGMLTGPVTIQQWSFVRDDQPRRETCHQIALAIRDEVQDLENAGIRLIQIDEPALREGLPLRRADWEGYLRWAVDAFRIASAGVADETQIHTHMCYAEFNDIMAWIAAMDADVISIETSRSAMELLDGFVDFRYPNEIGPGVWDIHSPRVPSSAEMRDLLSKAANVIDADQLWVNPDCGLKTRGWPEVEASLKNLVTAAREMRRAA
ncbi:5-methyltetrahydropteroyltriglutamate--homocysteine S-methyltransferase [Rhodovibrio sodomensis]|uniref:5-methyltetrahydropteroyltriglutamate--homocysteine methyltransferase n=1 Tax=Rhodovibrio sodomensis TaxID=1088 RepID=A0ABS1DK15_9PROT|nr:5-methyltetrahydropteroyltriglutamate--homocysteine S-methyltransferase [Rhodovibrio sodomensis]MBK1670693.1 5-methyltetrahydropteroyltriglutamate--homocysteine S-methyltransferase [Rhodovibrio sodomensis]